MCVCMREKECVCVCVCVRVCEERDRVWVCNGVSMCGFGI